MDLLVKNGRVVDPARKIDAVTDILIRGWKDSLDRQSANADIPAVRCTGLIVAPGFFDIHVHLREPGTEEAETIATGGAAAVAGGFVAVAAMPNTKPPNDNPSITSYIISEAKRSSPALVFPIGAITKEQKGETLAEIGEMVEAGIVGISDDGKPVMDGRLFRRALEYAQLFDLPVIQHCEDLNLSQGRRHARRRLFDAPRAERNSFCAEDTMVSRDLILAEMTGGKYHVAHLSTRRAVEMVREAKAQGLKITAEVTPHHFTLTDAAVAEYDTNAKMNPPLRSQDDVDALREGIRGRNHRRHCQRSCATSHQSEDAGIRRAPFGITGLETAVGLAFTQLKLPLPRLIEMFSLNPQKIMRVTPWGMFEGSDAHLTILDPTRKWKFDVNESRSKSRNSPFHGWEMKGQSGCHDRRWQGRL